MPLHQHNFNGRIKPDISFQKQPPASIGSQTPHNVLLSCNVNVYPVKGLSLPLPKPSLNTNRWLLTTSKILHIYVDLSHLINSTV